MQNEEYIIRCECGDKTDHVIHIAQYDIGEDCGDDSMGQCVVSLRLDPRAFWYKRVWLAFKYIFGIGNHYQYVDTYIDVQSLKEVAESLKDTRSDERKEQANADKTIPKVY